MNNKELNSELRQAAIKNGLCKQWQEEWKQDWDHKKMVSQFYRGIDFYLKKRFMSNDFLKENFDRDFLRKNGILVDDTYSLLNPDRAVFIGESSSHVRFNGRNSATIYILDKSKVKVTSRGEAFVIVHLLGSAELEAEQLAKSEIVAVVHSGDCKVTDGSIRVRYELNYLK